MLKPVDKLDWKNYDVALELLEYGRYLGSIFTDNGGFVGLHSDTLCKETVYTFYNEAIDVFAQRYNERKIDQSLIYENYLKEKLIQQFIEDLEIDRDKLWFAVLFSYDFCCDYCNNGQILMDSCRNELSKLAEKIDENTEGWTAWQGAIFKSPLTLTLSNGNKKEDIVLSNPTSLYYIAELVKQKIQSIPIDRDNLTDSLLLSGEKTELISSIKISHFARMLLQLFDLLPQVERKRKKGSKHSQKETDLVCQLIYFTGLSLNKRWKDTENDYLKSFIRSYKVPENVIGTIYPIN